MYKLLGKMFMCCCYWRPKNCCNLKA